MLDSWSRMRFISFLLNTSGTVLYSLARVMPPVILPFPAFHLLIVELDGVDAHVLLRNGNFLFVYKIKNVLVDVRHFQAVDVAPFVVLHEVAEISPVGLYGGWAVAFLFQQFQIAFCSVYSLLGLGCRTYTRL